MKVSEVESALLERFRQDLNEVMEKNLHKEYPYWIVFLMSPTFNYDVSGRQIIKQSMVVLDVLPPTFSRGIVFEVDNTKKTFKIIQRNLGYTWLEPVEPNKIKQMKLKG